MTSAMPPLDIESLQRAYRDGAADPAEIVASVVDCISSDLTPGVWIHVRPRDELVTEARALAQRTDQRSPLYGVPFAVKDNIHVGGMPTTMACPAYARRPSEGATVVNRLLMAGAICIGKTNLDQFATGLVGVRSPYGIPPNPFDPSRVTGGSSSGSAAAVARGHVTFAVATDTAGSGRVPAAFNHVVGVKPSPGLLSTAGVVPACRSLDCVSIMSLTCADAAEVLAHTSGFDPLDEYSRRPPPGLNGRIPPIARGWRIGVPSSNDLAACDARTRFAFEVAIDHLRALGLEVRPVNMTPFFEAGRLLYEGPWIAERLSGLEAFVKDHGDAVLPVIRAILSGGERVRGTDAFRGVHTLRRLHRAIEAEFSSIAALMVPTAPTHPTIEEVLADPIARNTHLGTYTTFANLLDLAAVAVPTGLGPDGLPSGVTFLGPWGSDLRMLGLASAIEDRVRGPLGATGFPRPESSHARAGDAFAGRLATAGDAFAGRHAIAGDALAGMLPIAVVGAHLTGMPLNTQLIERGATLLRATRTAPSYRLYALPDTRPPKPGLVRVADGGGASIALEVWAVPLDTVGSFLANVGAPLAIGTLELEDGDWVHGFLCESHAVARAEDISRYGGWRAYVAR